LRKRGKIGNILHSYTRKKPEKSDKNAFFLWKVRENLLTIEKKSGIINTLEMHRDLEV
jgi:hypothetical protein